MTAPVPFINDQAYLASLRDSTVRGLLPRDPYADVKRYTQLFGEPTHLGDPAYTGIRRDAIHNAMNYTASQRLRADTAQSKDTESRVRDEAVFDAARRHGVPPLLALAVSHVEAWGGAPESVGAYGEVGVMQVNPRDWAKRIPGRLDDLQVNADAGAKILRHFYDQYGSWEKAVRAYNGSPDSPQSRDYLDMVRTRMKFFTSDHSRDKGIYPDVQKLRAERANATPPR